MDIILGLLFNLVIPSCAGLFAWKWFEAHKNLENKRQKVKRLEKDIKAATDRLANLSRYEQVLDAESEAKIIVDRAKLIAKELELDAYDLLENAKSEAIDTKEKAKEKAEANKKKAEEILQQAHEQADKIIDIANIRAKEIAGDALESKGKADTFEQKAKAMKNLIEGYGEEYLLSAKTLLDEAEARNQRAMSMAQQTRRGHVYVISNVGSFGENIYKIGLTRRLEPMDRVKELGDASVPFDFDVHAMIYAEDAPALEKELHSHFESHQINKVNPRKEFFKVGIKDIREIVDNRNIEAHWTMKAEAREYFESMAIAKKVGIYPKEPSLPIEGNTEQAPSPLSV